MIEVDAWIDSSLFHIGRFVAARAEAISIFMRRRLTAKGAWRWLTEILGDGMTLASLGAVLILALALPAFDATRVDWRSQGDFAVTFLDRYGNEIGKRGIRLDNSVELEEMPDHLLKAVLATEDRRFFVHFGIDLWGTARALIENLRANAVVQGGSSITQQLAKNIFLTNERTIERKIKEAFIALWLEANLSKNEILKLYLDRAYMGGGNFGVEAASAFYFDKSVKDVGLAESALLAGLFKAPTRFAPHINLPAARARANEVLTNMVQAGFLTEGQVIGARRRPADVVEQADAAASPNYFLDWAFQQVKAQEGLFDRVLTVRTTIDMNLQAAAEEAVESSLRQFGDTFRVRQAALVAMEPDGAVRAMVGGRDYGESQFNRATGALRQPGSSFKPYVYATAMLNGFTPESVIRDAPICIGNWCPRNYSGGYSGSVNLTRALVKSINTVPVRLAEAIGRDKIVDVTRNMGVTSDLRITRSLPLGASEVTVLDMAAGYSVFASGGLKAPPHAFTQMLNGRGDVIFDRRSDVPQPDRALPEPAVAAMNEILAQIPEWGTGRRAKLDGIRTAGKTGTTSAYRDAWFVGFTGNYTAAVWFGNDDYAPTRRLTGGRLPAQTWKQFMSFAHQGIELKAIPLIEDPGIEAAPSPALAAGPEAGAARQINLSTATTQRLRRLKVLLESRRPVPPAAASLEPNTVTGFLQSTPDDVATP